jgi:bifunctional DNA-binding transcriptional regulator/antitoxin component of YhaV-PrlF toxin-antitoxin module
MTKTYIDFQGYCHHIASFEGRRNKLKSLLLLALKTEPGNKSLSSRQLEQLTGLEFISIINSITKWSHWHNHYLNRKGKRRLYRYNLAIYGAEFLEILHRVRPDKEEEYLNIITTNREKRESERINIIPKQKKLSPEEEELDRLAKQAWDDVKSNYRTVIPKDIRKNNN